MQPNPDELRFERPFSFAYKQRLLAHRQSQALLFGCWEITGEEWESGNTGINTLRRDALTSLDSALVNTEDPPALQHVREALHKIDGHLSSVRMPSGRAFVREAGLLRGVAGIQALLRDVEAGYEAALRLGRKQGVPIYLFDEDEDPIEAALHVTNEGAISPLEFVRQQAVAEGSLSAEAVADTGAPGRPPKLMRSSGEPDVFEPGLKHEYARGAVAAILGDKYGRQLLFAGVPDEKMAAATAPTSTSETLSPFYATLFRRADPREESLFQLQAQVLTQLRAVRDATPALWRGEMWFLYLRHAEGPSIMPQIIQHGRALSTGRLAARAAAGALLRDKSRRTLATALEDLDRAYKRGQREGKTFIQNTTIRLMFGK